MNRILLRNGKVIHPDRVADEDILIIGERISRLGPNLPADESTIVLDCRDRLIFPGLIDAHTHMGVPIKDGFSLDDFLTGSRAALHGGVTTIIDFTVLNDDQTLHESVLDRHANAREALTDYALHCNITRFDEQLISELPDLISQGILSYKVFTTYEEAGMYLTYEQIRSIAQVLADEGGLLMVHAEDNDVLRNAARPLFSKRTAEPIYHALSRPDEAEVRAIEQLGRIADEIRCPIYIVHLSSARGLECARRFEGLLVETCPQYLLLDEEVYHREDGRMFVTSPPLRKIEDLNALWQGLETGAVRTIGTDHCPFMLADKQQNIPFQDIPNGMGGVETMFPVLLSQFLERGLDLSLLVRLLGSNPAEIFGLAPGKGSLAEASDADLVVVDPTSSSRDWLPDLVSIADWNAYAGFSAIFPEHVFRRGEWVVKNGQLQPSRPGKFIPGKAPNLWPR
ncbi:MAG: amidohydrolase family protein [Candidatus Neomarinimicrobiota bacterium]